jgi:hypothetical protein
VGSRRNSWLGLLVWLLGAGCGRLPKAGAPITLLPVAEGHVHLGALYPLHPLWPQLAALQQEVYQLAAAEPTADQPPALSTERFQPGLLRPLWGVAPPPAPTLSPPPWAPESWRAEALPPDLSVSLQWHTQRAVRRHQQALAQARAREQAWLAAQEAQLWREYQVALNNLRIRQAMGGPEAREASAAYQRALESLRGKLAAAQEEAQERLRQAAARLDADLQAELANLEQQARAAAQQRQVPALSTGADELAELEALLNLRWWVPEEPAEAPPPELLAALSRRYQQARERQAAAYGATCRAQAARLQASAARLQQLIPQEVEAVARAQALAHGVWLHICPQEEPRGPDLTAQCRQWLRAHFGGA